MLNLVERFEELMNDSKVSFDAVNDTFNDIFNTVLLSNKTYASTLVNAYSITISSPSCIVDLDLNNGITVRHGELDIDVVYMTIAISKLRNEMLRSPEKIGAFVARLETSIILRWGNTVFSIFKEWNQVTGHSTIAHQIAFESGKTLEDPVYKQETPVKESNPERIERRTRRLW